MGEEAKRGCLRRGCLGCLGVFGFGLIGFILLVAVSLIQGRAAEIRETPTTTHELPPRVDFFPPPAADAVTAVPSDRIGRVVLDVSMAQFVVVPAPAGSPIRLESDYDAGSYLLREELDPHGETGWTYRLRFERRRKFNLFLTDANNRLELHLPAGVPLTIEGKVGVGETRMRLGGLWVQELDLDVGIGDHRFEFDEPLAAPMEKLRLDGSIGDMRLAGLGNASPASVRIDHSIGDLRVDLKGDWRTNSQITIAAGIGGCRVGVPDADVWLDLTRLSTGIGDLSTRRLEELAEPSEGAPKLELRVTHTIGEVYFTR